MARSRKRTPIFGCAIGASEKRDKKAWHRRFRRLTRVRIQKGDEPPDIKDVSDPWGMAKDGKYYWGDADEKSMRK